MIEHVAAALGADGVEQVALAPLEVELAVDLGVDIHQAYGARQRALPDAVRLDNPRVPLGDSDGPGEDVLRAIKAFLRADIGALAAGRDRRMPGQKGGGDREEAQIRHCVLAVRLAVAGHVRPSNRSRIWPL